MEYPKSQIIYPHKSGYFISPLIFLAISCNLSCSFRKSSFALRYSFFFSFSDRIGRIASSQFPIPFSAFQLFYLGSNFTFLRTYHTKKSFIPNSEYKSTFTTTAFYTRNGHYLVFVVMVVFHKLFLRFYSNYTILISNDQKNDTQIYACG